MPNVGPLELIVVLVIVLVIFGPKRLPTLGRQLGRGMKEFKDSITGDSHRDEDEEDRPALDTTTTGAKPAEPAPVTPAEPAPATPAEPADQTRV